MKDLPKSIIAISFSTNFGSTLVQFKHLYKVLGAHGPGQS